MAKVTARNADGQEVAVHQVQFNNRGEVESFLTTLTNGHKAWVHAHDYDVTVAEGEPEFEQAGVMTKDTALNPNQQINKAAPIVNGVPEITAPAGTAQPAAPAQTVDEGVLDTADLGIDQQPPAPTEPVVEPPVPPQTTAPVTPPVDPIDEPIVVDPAADSGIISEGDLPTPPANDGRPPRPDLT